MVTIPPHDIIGLEYEQYLPKGEGAAEIISTMKQSREVLAETLINKKREASGKLCANSLWLWGQGKNLKLPTFEEKFGIVALYQTL